MNQQRQQCEEKGEDFRQSPCALMLLCIGRTALYAIASGIDWKKVEQDCTRAIQLDPNSVKAHYMLGRALLKKHEYSEGIKELKRVLDLGGRGANPESYIVGDIWKEFTTAKYLEWERESSKRLWDLQSLEVACEHALVEKQFLDSSQPEGVSDEDINAISAQLELLGRVFDKAAEVDLPTEVPDHLCCKISYDIFYDPVITPTGITDKRAVIVDHLQKVGNFDPRSKRFLTTMVGHTRWTEKYYLVNDEKSLESEHLIFDFNSHFDALAIVLGFRCSGEKTTTGFCAVGEKKTTTPGFCP
ncbi:unnamed protein product [Camellia sinensis]